MTTLFYISSLILVTMSISSFPQGIIGGILTRLTRNILLSMLVGAIVTWLGIEYLWVAIEGDQIPVSVLGCSFLILIIHGSISHEKLNENAKHMMAAELWAIIIVGVIVGVLRSGVRWY